MNGENRYVSTAQVAQALGVSVTTVKRWVDEGVLPAHRTAGGHRKLLMADVIRLVREGSLPQADLSRLVPKTTVTDVDPDALQDQLYQAVSVPDPDLIRSIIHAGYHSGLSIETLADRVVSPVMMSLGHDWLVGNADIMHEHRVTQSMISALYELKSFLRVNAEKDRPIAVGGSPEHDHYVMPSLLAKLTLLDSGWNAINLGPHTPFSAFTSAIESLNPQLVWLSVSHIADPEKFLSQYREFFRLADERGIAVAIGGRAIQDSLRVQMPYTTYGDGFTQLAAFARTIFRRPQRPRRGRPPTNAQNGNDHAPGELPGGEPSVN